MQKYGVKIETTNCKFCGAKTTMLATKLCDKCWSAEKIFCLKEDIINKIALENGYQLVKIKHKKVDLDIYG